MLLQVRFRLCRKKTRRRGLVVFGIDAKDIDIGIIHASLECLLEIIVNGLHLGFAPASLFGTIDAK